ncbi:MAG: hypothetical protein A2W90_16300 [Bacteroidetes bacterium GWF2_42_66]|nr:MAG: hypothetical protein A2W92_07660 [Bacteroidetes bacterium GWA2_42_15]OFX96257.1 MAG: hypothetical protein A2W89_05230 [Bacteroidetes bacterium GWE2_42_39]OFY46296.1 MAG: hypothetical protein A2W90_16300 [Bacteroidetes bacterium GWF2_42_66]HBL78323.1 aromatic hydrocarbon degradation protein [Prolixibacteraceae bacterium]HCR90834.1 aromatic hydrocarbon degradation protein [Prolixibacteraceae bacterium]
MKKLVLLPALVVCVVNLALAGGILTNTNQSAQFVRMLSRNASTDLDAVYFNPAGLMVMENGFHFGVHNQTIFQKKTIVSENPLLMYDNEYIGDVKAPVFPTAFAVYKTDKYALSLGFGPNGGGGSATFDTGLPSFEGNIAKLVPALSSLSALGFPVQAYDVDINFEGTSVFWGIQLGLSYKVSDAFSVYGGARYLPSKNTYAGTMTNIQLGPTGDLQNGSAYLTEAATYATGLGNTLKATATSLNPIISGGAGSYTIPQAQSAGIISAAQAQQLTGGLVSLGVSSTQASAMPFTQVQATYSAAGTQMLGTGTTLAANASNLGDKEVDTEQTGTGFTPILGANIHLEKLNIGIKYEFETKLELENKTTVDDMGLFPDGKKTRSDLPAILAIGADYKVTDKLKASLSYNLYFDKGVDWGLNIYNEQRTIDKNYVEIALGAEYAVSDKLALSIGAMSSNMGVDEAYQSDFSYSNDSYTGGLGFSYKLSEKLILDAGFMYTAYVKDEKDFGTYKESYDKRTIVGAIGIAYKIF